MRIIHRYITNDYLVTFLITVSIFTFVMSAAAMIRAIDLLAKGLSGALIIKFFLLNIPYMLMFTIPMSALTAVLLLFGKLSIDGEITAMRASGLSMWQIISPVIILSIVLTGVCAYINCFMAPNSHYAERKVLVEVGVTQPINLLEPGRFVRDFPGLMVYVSERKKNTVKDIVVYEMRSDGTGVRRNVRAKSGELRPGDEHEPYVLYIDLYNVRIDQPDEENPHDPTAARYVSARHYPVKLDFSKILKKGEVKKRTADMTLWELSRNIRNIHALHPGDPPDVLLQERMKMVVEANTRVALSISCFAFTLLGIPLAMKSRRRES